jgi:U3 small nucleolar RNA-associated protein 14
VKQFENSKRQPIGNTWNTETAYRSLTEPKMITKMGQIIEPIDETALIKKPDNNNIEKKEKRRGKKSIKAQIKSKEDS